VINLNSIDYRLLHAMSIENYYHPAGTKETESKIQHVWDSLTNRAPGTAMQVQVA
jgi:predicted ATPase